ncbi:MAG: tryptophan synthase subunit alpha [Burkholderiaceae bacterium]|nr:tryptophan synthase subunit alpha [Burkholderiaceae bacterium]
MRETFERLRAAKQVALIPFVTAGYPERATTVALMHELAACGADVIELGVPFSDPMADGPVIQRASEQALRNGIGMADVLAFVRAFRSTDSATPVVLMGYANPIERMGTEAFLAAASAAGVDGVLVVDYPPEESADFAAAARECGIDPIYLLAPTSEEERIDAVARLASGYVYYVSLRGVTGAGHLDTADVIAHLARIKSRIALPVGVGFGIRDGATARALGEHADAVVIGSRLIELIDDGDPAQGIARAASFIAAIRHSLDQG